jgi:hypothetical protein
VSIDLETIRALLDPLAAVGLQIIILLLAAGVVVKAITKSWHPVRQTIDWTETLAKLVAGQDEINAVVQQELMRNGGGSLKDQVSRIDSSVEALHGRMRAGEQRFESLEARLPERPV